MLKKRILVSAYFAKNIGDDLFLKILFDRYPNVQWDLLTANRNYNEIFKQYDNVKIIYTYRDVKFGRDSFNLFYRLNNILFKFRKYDGFVNIGGSIFMQSPAWKLKIDERKYLLNIFKNLNKRTFILGSNFGPFKDELFLKEYKELFSEFDDVCFRDLYSYNIFKELDNVRVAPDIVFSLKDLSNIHREKKVGFSIINLASRDELVEYNDIYIQKVADLIIKYIDLGYKVSLFSFCNNEGDLDVIQYIKSKIESDFKDNIDVISYEGNIVEFLKEIKSCEVIIGTRFHSIILSLIFGQAVFPLIYSEKTFNVLKDLNMEKVCCFLKDIGDLDVNKVISLASKNKLLNKEVFSEAEKHFEKLDEYLGKYKIKSDVM